MSSGFVSGGTIEASKGRDVEWLQAQKDLEKSKREEEEAATQEGSKSLYEVLQGNKATKQYQYEESLRLKNQFRALDDDEIDFLDSVLESTRDNERKIKQETVELLDVFRKQRAEADKTALDETVEGRGEGEGIEVGTSWGKKRKRKEKDTNPAKSAKTGRTSTTEKSASKRDVSAEDSIERESEDTISRTLDAEARGATTKTILESKTLPQQASTTSPTTTQPQNLPPPKPKLDLIGYGSSNSDSD